MAGFHQAQDVLGVVQVEPGDALLFDTGQEWQLETLAVPSLKATRECGDNRVGRRQRF